MMKASQSFPRLLIFLLIYLLVSPFVSPDSGWALLVHTWLTLVLFFSVRAIEKKGSGRSAAGAVLVAAVLLYWLGIFEVVPFSSEGALGLFVIFFGLVIYSMVRQLVRVTRVTAEVLCGTLCVYLLIGLLWGSIYALTGSLLEGAYAGTLLEESGGSLHMYNYFSMITLTSVGYGDITPQMPGPAAFCQIEAIIGQFFTAVVVGWLVGMYGKPTPRGEQLES